MKSGTLEACAASLVTHELETMAASGVEQPLDATTLIRCRPRTADGPTSGRQDSKSAQNSSSGSSSTGSRVMRQAHALRASADRSPRRSAKAAAARRSPDGGSRAQANALRASLALVRGLSSRGSSDGGAGAAARQKSAALAARAARLVAAGSSDGAGSEGVASSGSDSDADAAWIVGRALERASPRHLRARS